jgi:hypothetical protein
MTSLPLSTAPRRRRPQRFLSLGMPVLCVLTALSATPPRATPTTDAPQSSLVAVAPGARRAGPSPLDEPLHLIAEARKAYSAVHDYSCTMIKLERLEGGLTPAHVVTMNVRTEPFAVDLKWQLPKDYDGQEACYVCGKNDGNMRVKSAGLLGALGFISLGLNDARVKETSRHSITEAGLGSLIERFARCWEEERNLGVTKVRLAEYEYDHRRCTRVETLQPPETRDRFKCQRVVLYFDRETHLPIRLECFDWPKRDGEAGELLESYSYPHLKLNVGLSDAVFDH